MDNTVLSIQVFIVHNCNSMPISLKCRREVVEDNFKEPVFIMPFYYNYFLASFPILLINLQNLWHFLEFLNHAVGTLESMSTVILMFVARQAKYHQECTTLANIAITLPT